MLLNESKNKTTYNIQKSVRTSSFFFHVMEGRFGLTESTGTPSLVGYPLIVFHGRLKMMGLLIERLSSVVRVSNPHTASSDTQPKNSLTSDQGTSSR
jgi:hypothetical protein